MNNGNIYKYKCKDEEINKSINTREINIKYIHIFCTKYI